jgi:hypothetical protein
MFDDGQGVAQDHAEAVRWYRLAAAQGVAYAQYNLGFMFKNGRGVAQDDAEAVRWWRLAAAQGHVIAQFKLSVMFEYESVPPGSTQKGLKLQVRLLSCRRWQAARAM